VSNAVADVFPDETVDMIFVQGNHDATGCGTVSSGANDTYYYGVFVLNENDYRSYPLTTVHISHGPVLKTSCTARNEVPQW